MSLSTYLLEYGRHLARLRRRRAHAPTNNTVSPDRHEKINSWFPFLSYMSMGFRLIALLLALHFVRMLTAHLQTEKLIFSDLNFLKCSSLNRERI